MGTKNSNSINPDKRKGMPPRGKSKKTLILDAIREKSLLGLDTGATREEAEISFFSHIAERAFDVKDQNSATLIKVLMDKGWANVKPVMESVEFEFDATEPHEQAIQILRAVSTGQVPPDVANMLISSVSSMIKIEEVTEIKKEIDKIKEMLGLSNG